MKYEIHVHGEPFYVSLVDAFSNEAFNSSEIGAVLIHDVGDVEKVIPHIMVFFDMKLKSFVLWESIKVLSVEAADEADIEHIISFDFILLTEWGEGIDDGSCDDLCDEKDDGEDVEEVEEGVEIEFLVSSSWDESSVGLIILDDCGRVLWMWHRWYR